MTTNMTLLLAAVALATYGLTAYSRHVHRARQRLLRLALDELYRPLPHD